MVTMEMLEKLVAGSCATISPHRDAHMHVVMIDDSLACII